MSKVLIPVKGGLGNQMFFYAFSLSLKANGLNPKFIWYEYIFTKQHNGVELINAFDIKFDKWTNLKISIYCKLNNILYFSKIKQGIGRIIRLKYSFYKRVEQNNPYSFDIHIFDSRDGNVYFDGFWQNYQYLEPIKSSLRGFFSFKLPNNYNCDKYLVEIERVNSVSIHIRRGDYLDPTFKELNVINSSKYYFDSINYIRSMCVDPIFFIFSDDMEWAKTTFIDEKYIFVEGNKNRNSYLDMFLMSKCRHNIIANSTFSWWGAWLNENSRKIVISPVMWTDKIFSSQLCPQDWVFLKT
ncbi:MAG: alpha-1,2-fucosyltransferase [Paludibacter sp.]|nr:alpha-1,2-fucosyltransferase [Paludibacter sp.]